MLAFSNPIWLAVAAVAAALGVWALWRARRRGQKVSSLKLWRELALVQGGEARRHRRVDPLWVLVFLAAVFAGLALAGPTWVEGREVPEVAVDWAVRSIGSEVQGWVKVPAAWEERDVVLAVNGVAQKATVAELQKGVAVALAGVGDHVMLELNGAEGRLAACTFVKPAGEERAFGVLEVTSDGRKIDAALERVFLVQRGATMGDPSIEPRVGLVNGKVEKQELAGAALVVAEGETELPGVKVGKRVEAGGEGWKVEVGSTGGKWPGMLGVDGIRVKAMREAELSAEWEVLARVMGKPWLAVRKEGKGVWVWVASAVLGETNWAKEAGFVVFFAEMQRVAMGDFAGGAVSWEARPLAKEEVRKRGLAGFFGGGGIVMLVVAVGWFLGRGRKSVS